MGPLIAAVAQLLAGELQKQQQKQEAARQLKMQVAEDNAQHYGADLRPLHARNARMAINGMGNDTALTSAGMGLLNSNTGDLKKQVDNLAPVPDYASEAGAAANRYGSPLHDLASGYGAQNAPSLFEGSPGHRSVLDETDDYALNPRRYGFR